VIYDVRHSGGFGWQDIYKPSFMTIDTGVHAILRFFFLIRNLRGLDAGSSDERDL
jgi:hypothetical protein